MRRLLRVLASPSTSAAAAWSPWAASYPAPTHGVWAGDLALADGAAVSSWANRSGGGDPAQAVALSQPTYRASGIGGKPAVQFDGGDVLDVDIADIAQPYKLVVVYQYTSLPAAEVRFVGAGNLSTNRGFGRTSTGTRRIQMSAVLAGSAENTNAHIATFVVNGASSSITVDGVSDASGDAGAGSIARFVLGAGHDGTLTGNNFTGYIAFAAFYASSADVSGLTTRMRTEYGI